MTIDLMPHLGKLARTDDVVFAYTAGYYQAQADEEARSATSDPEYRWYHDVRGELGWRIVDVSEALTRLARRVSGGATPTGEESDHLLPRAHLGRHRESCSSAHQAWRRKRGKHL